MTKYLASQIPITPLYSLNKDNLISSALVSASRRKLFILWLEIAVKPCYEDLEGLIQV